MAKILKIVGLTVGNVLEWVMILLIVFLFLVRTSAVQTWIGRQATTYLSKELHSELRIGKIDIYFYDRIALDDVFVRDLHGDTLVSLKSIKVAIDLFHVDDSDLRITSVALENGRVGIDRDSITGDYNYEFIEDYFSTPKKHPKKHTESQVSVGTITLDNIHLSYHDYRKSYDEFGVDFSHLDFRNLYLKMHDLKVKGDNIAFNLEHFQAYEHAGFDLRRLQAKAEIGDKGILLSDVKINTYHSKIFASKLNFRMDGLKRLDAFEDSVTFDARIDSSMVNLYDVSMFAHDLRGMNQRIALSATVSEPLKKLKIEDIDLQTGKKTILRGNLVLPDFRDPEKSFLSEVISYAYVDMNDVSSLRLPLSSGGGTVVLTDEVKNIGFAQLNSLTVNGYWSEFTVAMKELKSGVGKLHLPNALRFTELKEGGYEFVANKDSGPDLIVDSLNLRQLLDDSIFGTVKGQFLLTGVVGQDDGFRLTEIQGEINRAGINGYDYTNIAISEGSFIKNVFASKIDINDPALHANYEGQLDLNEHQQFNVKLNVTYADLGRMNFAARDSTLVVASLVANIEGTNINDYSGYVDVNRLTYKEDSLSITIPALTAGIQRNAQEDIFRINSSVADILLKGKIDPTTIGVSLNNALVPYLPSYISFQPFPKKKKDFNKFYLEVTAKDTREFLAIFSPGLSLASGTKVSLDYNAPQFALDALITSGLIRYDDMRLTNFRLNDTMVRGKANLAAHAEYFNLNDSLRVRNFNVLVDGGNNKFRINSDWNQGLSDPASLIFEANVYRDSMDIAVDPSYFSLKGQQWNIKNASHIFYSGNKIAVDHLTMERETQYISLDGIVSNNEKDVLTAKVNDLHLEEFAALLSPGVDISGRLNGDVQLATPFTVIQLNGSLTASDLYINRNEVGDVSFNARWDKQNEKVVLNGDLKYLKNETFDFTGQYYPYRKDNNILMDLIFNETDIAFANAFMDPDVVRDISGKLKGNIKISGRIESPTIDGTLNLENGRAKIQLLGTYFRANGPIHFNGRESAFEINRIPLYDEEGNKAFLTGTINHRDFSSWTTDISIDIDQRYTKRFLVNNTLYNIDNVYYGKAYVTGTANIFVTDTRTEILVDVQTEQGTNIDIPLYGNSELKESEVIDFSPSAHGAQAVNLKDKIDLSGVDLQLNFDVTSDAQLNIIFDENTNPPHAISVRGDGLISIDINPFGDLNMQGTYVVDNGEYNFVLGPVKQVFHLQEGGSISWTGDPLNAQLDIRTYNIIRANINDVGLTDIDARSNSNQEIYTILTLKQTLESPLIEMDIQAPKASESEKAILARIRSDKDELQRQFFSLLLLKKFVPINGGAGANGSGLADAVAGQINSALSQIQGVQLSVGYTSSEALQSQSYEVNAAKTLGQNKNIVLKTSFGVSNTNQSSQTQSQLIGDMSLEYLINADGTFRVSVFNESNENNILQTTNNRGGFTQGVGLHYQEDFNGAADFKLLQYVLDLFRKEKHIKRTSRRQEVSVKEPIPLDPSKESADAAPPVILPQDDNSKRKIRRKDKLLKEKADEKDSKND